MRTVSSGDSLAACLYLARAFREWYLRPSTREQRGFRLLREWLSLEQLAQYDAHGYFEVIGCHTGKRYRICHGNGANIIKLEIPPCRERAGASCLAILWLRATSC
jgi:hypothetical protein